MARSIGTYQTPNLSVASQTLTKKEEEALVAIAVSTSQSCFCTNTSGTNASAIFLTCNLDKCFPFLTAGNILLNVLIPPNMPCTRTGKNNVLIVCVPNPPLAEKNASVPATMLIRVKTSEDADELHKILQEKKGA